MCKICEPILGKNTLPHTEETCALRQGSYCPICGPGTHFARFCPNMSRAPISDTIKAIPSDRAPPTEPIIVLADTNDGYIEYLKQHGLPISRKIQENRARVEDDLASRNPSIKLVNPIIGKNVKQKK
jgi:hypothetical protein